MARARLACGLVAAIAIALLPSAALAQPVVPPGNSAANQYTETFPTAGGGAPSKDKGKQSPTKVLSAQTTRQLEAKGSQGRAAAVVVTETAPAPIVTSPEKKVHTGRAKDHPKTKGARHGEGHKGNKAAPAAGSGSTPGGPSGSSGLGEVIAQATGSSSTGQMGLLLPLAIAATVVWSLAYLWRRKRRTA